MDRRKFLQSGTAAATLASLPRISFAQQLPFNPRPGAWRSFEVTTRVEILRPSGASRAWVPVPSVEKTNELKPKDAPQPPTKLPAPQKSAPPIIEPPKDEKKK